jgi:hypothetical protein
MTDREGRQWVRRALMHDRSGGEAVGAEGITALQMARI